MGCHFVLRSLTAVIALVIHTFRIQAIVSYSIHYALFLKCYRNAAVTAYHKEVSTQEPFLWKDLWLWQFSLQWTMSTG